MEARIQNCRREKQQTIFRCVRVLSSNKTIVEMCQENTTKANIMSLCYFLLFCQMSHVSFEENKWYFTYDLEREIWWKPKTKNELCRKNDDISLNHRYIIC